MLQLLGLAARSGAVVVGTERVREALRGGQVRLLLTAVDASANSRAKLLPWQRQEGISVYAGYGREDLGHAVGRSPLSAVGVVHAGLAARLRELLGEVAPSQQVS